jgi:hypothetical protein
MAKSCAQCGSEFPSYVEIDGKMRHLWNRKRCLSCAPFGGSTRHAADRRPSEKKGRCLGCLRQLPDSAYYKNSSGKLFPRCRRCMRVSVTERARALKEQAVAYKGGLCLKCGKMPHIAAMSFHHRNPTEKEFEIGARKGSSLDAIKVELDKCDLLCRNCHAIEHWDASYNGEGSDS